jgi:hypothetical protein
MTRGRTVPDFSAPPRFRVGMTITCDPTPFLLGGSAIKVPQPSFAEAGPRVSVQAVGRIREGADELSRLYLPEGQGMSHSASSAGARWTSAGTSR